MCLAVHDFPGHDEPFIHCSTIHCLAQIIACWYYQHNLLTIQEHGAGFHQRIYVLSDKSWCFGRHPLANLWSAETLCSNLLKINQCINTICSHTLQSLHLASSFEGAERPRAITWRVNVLDQSAHVNKWIEKMEWLINYFPRSGVTSSGRSWFICTSLFRVNI